MGVTECPDPEGTTHVENTEFPPPDHVVIVRITEFREARDETRRSIQNKALLLGFIFVALGYTVIVFTYFLHDPPVGLMPAGIVLITTGVVFWTITDVEPDERLLDPNMKSAVAYYSAPIFLFVTVCLEVSTPHLRLKFNPVFALTAVVCVCVVPIGCWTRGRRIQDVPRLLLPTSLASLAVLLNNFGLFYKLALHDLSGYTIKWVPLAISVVLSVSLLFNYTVLFIHLRHRRNLMFYCFQWCSYVLQGIFFISQGLTYDWPVLCKLDNVYCFGKVDSVLMGIVSIIGSLLWLLYRKQVFGFLTAAFDNSGRIANGALLASMVANVNAKQVVENAARRLRCIRPENITIELLQVPNGDSLHLSEPCKFGEIDFFVCHSWADCPREKYAVLMQVTQEFEKEHGRKPTFWLDKPCLNVSEHDLRCLPVFLMASTTLLTIVGPSFHLRLWCAWEMYCFYALTQSTAHIHLRIMDVSGSEEACRALVNYKLENADCFSVEDKKRLIGVISEDPSRFVESIRTLAQKHISEADQC